MDKKKARIALRKSIKHWCLDIRRPLLSGDTVEGDFWVNSGKRVKRFSISCSLCRTYTKCIGCPLVTISERCYNNDSVYMMFYINSDIHAANNMISTLVECYRRVQL